MQKRFLITPGPTPVPPEVLSALAEPVVHHRAPRFTEILKQVVAGMKYIYQTENDIIVYAASGTGAMESAVVNVVNPGDHVLVALRRQLRRALDQAHHHVGRRGDRAGLRVGHQGRARPISRRRWPPTRPSRPCSCSTARRPPAWSTTSRRSARSSPGRRRSSWSTPSAASAPPTSRPTSGTSTSAWPAPRRRSWCRRASPTRPSARRPGRSSSSAPRRASTSTASRRARR